MIFDEFDKISSKQWKNKIQFELDGQDFNSTVIWKSLEGIDVKPFYHEDLESASVSIDHNAHNWSIGQAIFVQNENTANKKAIKSLENGAESLFFIVTDAKLSLSTLLKDIDWKNIPIYFEPAILDTALTTELKTFFSRKKHAIFLLNDTIGNLARSGNWYHNMDRDIELISQNLSHLKHLKSVISVDASLYQNAGASIIQQLGYGLAHANEYLHLFQNDISKTMVFKFAIGSNYFFEIAKLQAFKLLWKSLMANHNMAIDCHIISIPSKRNKTIYDFNVNLLRATTETMSAALGGSNMILNMPYDAVYRKTNSFSDRLALNQLLILKKESHFDEVTNPTEGAYYIENLTQQLAHKALSLFKSIEKEGGFLKQLKGGKVQRSIAEHAKKEENLYKSKNEGLVGVHFHSDKDLHMKSQIELYPFLKHKPRKTIIKPIIEKRIAEMEEKKRLDNE